MPHVHVSNVAAQAAAASGVDVSISQNQMSKVTPLSRFASYALDKP